MHVSQTQDPCVHVSAFVEDKFVERSIVVGSSFSSNLCERDPVFLLFRNNYSIEGLVIVFDLQGFVKHAVPPVQLSDLQVGDYFWTLSSRKYGIANTGLYANTGLHQTLLGVQR